VSATEVYLDWNATAPPHPSVLEAMRAAELDAWGNPSSVHAAGRRARAVVEAARECVAELAGFDARDVLFTSGATEANNLALWNAPALITSRLEHASVVRVAEALEEQGRFVAWLPVPESGSLDPASLEEPLGHAPRGARVAVMAVNHETGVVQPLGEIARRAHAAGARLHVDAVQAAGKLPSSFWAEADSVALASHKIRGPSGIGALAWRRGGAPEPLLRGGAQERGLRPGSLDARAAAGFGAAARHALEAPARDAELGALRDRLEAVLAERARVNGAGARRLSHVSNLSFHGWRGDELVAALDLAGVRVSSGSACSAGSTEPSPVVTAMLGRERAAAAVRVSLGEDTAPGDIDAAIAAFLLVLGRAGGDA
jgi:cysteine desulfurase